MKSPTTATTRAAAAAATRVASAAAVAAAGIATPPPAASPECIQRWEDFWRRRNRGPLFSMTFPLGGPDFSAVIKPWMAPGVVSGGAWSLYAHEFLFGHAVEIAARTEDVAPLADALDYFDHYFAVTGHAGGGFPFLYANLGAMMMSALLTGFTRFDGSTIWLENDPPREWEELLGFGAGTRAPYADVALAALRQLTVRLAGRAVIGYPEMGGLLDILSALRGAQNLCLDLIDRPGDVHAILAALEGARAGFWKEIGAAVDPANRGLHTVTMRYLSARPFGMAMADCSAMISPAMFAEFCLPGLRREFAACSGRAVFHLDGPGQIPHVPQLCAEEDLFGIQWVYGTGNPDNISPRWDALYRQILDAGKRVFFCSAAADPDRLRTFFRRFPAREFYVPFTLPDAAMAVPLRRLADELEA